MELGLSLGGTRPKGFSFLDEKQDKLGSSSKDLLGFRCMKLLGSRRSDQDADDVEEDEEQQQEEEDEEEGSNNNSNNRVSTSPDDDDDVGHHPPKLQLGLFPFSPVPRSNQATNSTQLLSFPWLSQNLGGEPGSMSGPTGKGLELLGRRPSAAEDADEVASLSSPNSVMSSFQMDFSIYRSGGGGNLRSFSSGKRDYESSTAANDADVDRCGSSRASDEEENGAAGRKKLRLTKQQSAFLEESFKEHTTLNPKQKLALAKQLNLRPRQVEVWFQNRRARTKLKQTEVDCEYLKRCCEALTEENRRLQKELQELRALKTSQPFYMQLPATTLTMCPSCERTVSNNSTSTAAANGTTAGASVATTSAGGAANTTLSLAKPKPFPFSSGQLQAPQAASS